MANFNTFSAQIKTLLIAVQLAGQPAFVEVVEYPTNKFDGYPAASITPSEVVSDYATVAQNQRAYGFMVELYVGIDRDNPDSWNTTFSTMRDLVDGALDNLDKSIDLNGLASFLKAVPMQWTVQEAGQGLVLAADIHVIAIKDVPVY